MSAALAVIEAELEIQYRHLYPVPSPPPRPDPLTWAREKGVLRLADGRVLRFADVERPYQTAILTDRSPRRIVLKARQIGISQAIAFEVACEMLAGGTALIISRDQDTAGEFLGYVRTAILGDEDAPPLTTDNTYELELANGGRAVAQAATRKAGRGIPATLVVLDEQAWQDHAALIWAAVLPTLAETRGRLIVLSTPNGYGNLYHQLWDAAVGDAKPSVDRDGGTQGEGHGWSWHFLPWRVHPVWGQDDEWPERKKTEDRLTDEQFAQEFDCDFARSGSAVFDPEQVARLQRLPALQPALPNHRYVKAWDIARKQDAFVGFVIDISTSPFQVVHFERHLHLSYPDQATRIEAVHAAYPGETWVESNGVGDPLIQFLSIAVKEFVTTALTKRNAIDALLLLIQRDELASPQIPEWSRELLIYMRDDKAIMQDTVMASAIAALAAGRPVADNTTYISSYIGAGRR